MQQQTSFKLQREKIIEAELFLTKIFTHFLNCNKTAVLLSNFHPIPIMYFISRHKPSCDTRFLRAFTAWVCIFEVLTLVLAERTLKSRVATSLYSRVRICYISIFFWIRWHIYGKCRAVQGEAFTHTHTHTLKSTHLTYGNKVIICFAVWIRSFRIFYFGPHL